MSNQIDTSFVKEFGSGITLLSQQKGSKLRSGVMMKQFNRGEEVFFDQIGATEAQRTNTRHADSPLINTPHSRRRITPIDVDWGDLVDDFDKLKLLNDPTNEYVINAGYAVGREIDDIIIEQFFATASTGKDGSGTASLPGGNTVAVDFDGDGTDEGLTVDKLKAAKKIIMANNVDLDMPDNALYCAISAEQWEDLLDETEVVSADFNKRVLATGELGSYLGINFILTERLATDSNGDRRVPLWAKSGMGLGVLKEPTVRMSERADKRYSMYAYYCTSVGASRLEEAKVTEILCAE